MPVPPSSAAHPGRFAFLHRSYTPFQWQRTRVAAGRGYTDEPDTCMLCLEVEVA